MCKRKTSKGICRYFFQGVSMKKIVCALLLFLLSASVTFSSNVMPDNVYVSPVNTFGVYQVGHSLVIYNDPDENAPIKQKIIWSSENVIPQNLKLTDLFAVYIKRNDFALMSVTDETEDWVEIIYDNSSGARGWIKKDDPFKFNTWVNFYSMYGRKYGLKILKGAPQNVYELFGSPEDGAKKISVINKPQLINLNFIRGNWMLVTVVDADRTPKTGFIRWRSDDGVKYLFPDLR